MSCLSQILVLAIPDKALGLFGLLPTRTTLIKDEVEKGDRMAIAPPLVLRVMVLCEFAVVFALFIYLAVHSSSERVIQSEVSGVLKPSNSKYKCSVLSPFNTMRPFDEEIAESAHYSTAVQTSSACIANLTQITNNCDASLLDHNIISAYGYETSKIMCYAFFKNGEALCHASYTDQDTGETLYGSIPYRPARNIQRSFPNFENYPERPSGTFLRSFINGTIGDVTIDLTTDVSTSLMLGTGFAPTADPSGDNIYYVTSSIEKSTSTIAWKIWHLSFKGRHDRPKLLMTFTGGDEALYPAVDSLCGLAASKTQLWFAMKMFVNGVAKASVNVYGVMNLKTKEVSVVNAEALPSFDFKCTTKFRSITVSDDGTSYLMLRSGVLLGFPADQPFQPLNASTFSVQTPTTRGNMKMSEYLYIQDPRSGTWYPMAFYNTLYDLPISSFVVVGNIVFLALYTEIVQSVVIFGGNLAAPTRFSDVIAAQNFTVDDGNSPKIGVNFFPKGYVIAPAGLGIALTGLQALHAYKGFFDIFSMTTAYSALLTKSWKNDGKLYVMYSGQSLMLDTAALLAGGASVVADPLSNANYTHVWKNASVGWRVGVCKGKIVLASQISPGYSMPPDFSSLCNEPNGYFLQSSFSTQAVAACRTSTPDKLAQCPAVTAELKTHAVDKCRQLIRKACIASYDDNPPYICSVEVSANIYTAIGSALGNAQALFTIICVLATFVLQKLVCRKYTNKVYVDAIRSIEEQDLKIAGRFYLLDARLGYQTEEGSGSGSELQQRGRGMAKAARLNSLADPNLNVNLNPNANPNLNPETSP